MKKKTLLNTIIVLLLIIMGVSIIISGFIEGKAQGFAAIGILSFVYLWILIIVRCWTMNEKLHCGDCEHFDLCFDPYRDSDGFCEITERPMDKTDECNAI